MMSHGSDGGKKSAQMFYLKCKHHVLHYFSQFNYVIIVNTFASETIVYICLLWGLSDEGGALPNSAQSARRIASVIGGDSCRAPIDLHWKVAVGIKILNTLPMVWTNNFVNDHDRR